VNSATWASRIVSWWGVWKYNAEFRFSGCVFWDGPERGSWGRSFCWSRRRLSM